MRHHPQALEASKLELDANSKIIKTSRLELDINSKTTKASRAELDAFLKALEALNQELDRAGPIKIQEVANPWETRPVTTILVATSGANNTNPNDIFIDRRPKCSAGSWRWASPHHSASRICCPASRRRTRTVPLVPASWNAPAVRCEFGASIKAYRTGSS